MTYITAENLKKTYGSREVVKGISMKIEEHEVLAVIGPNGSGKTTTLEMLIGLKNQEQGQVSYWLENYKSSIGVQLQSIPFFPGLTALENLRLFASFYKKKLTVKRCKELLMSCGIAEAAGTEASKLSGGQQKRLAIAVALVHDPAIVFLDEPTSALDPRSRQDVHRIISNLHQNGKTVVFTSHDMDEVFKLATKVIMINEGVIIAEGEPKQLCEQLQVQNLESVYLLLTEKGGDQNDDYI